MPDQYSSNNSNIKIPKRSTLLTSKKNLIVLGVALVIICIGASIFYLHIKSINSKKAAEKLVPVRQDPAQALAKASDFDKTIVSADKFIAASSFDQAIKLLQKDEPKVTDPAQHYAIMARLGSAYFSKNDYVTSINWFERAQQTGQPGSDSLVVNIAMVAEKMGDKAKAIANYHKAIDLLRAHPDSGTDMSVQIYQNKIKVLGG